MSVDKSILGSIIFDLYSQIKQSDYSVICEDINTGRFTDNEIVLQYKKKTSVLEGCIEFVLSDGNTVFISEELISSLSNINTDKHRLIYFMSESKENLQKVIKVIYGNS